MRLFTILLICVIAAATLTLLPSVRAKDAVDTQYKSDTHIYEMRTYHAAEGKMEALHKRFREHSIRLLAKHGIIALGYWTPAEGEDAKNTLIYIVQFNSLAEKEKAWAAFRADPEWIKVKAESEKDGPLTTKVDSVLLNPTDYSALK